MLIRSFRGGPPPPGLIRGTAYRVPTTVVVLSCLAMPAKLNVVIYSRPGCHLCDEAKQIIAAAGCTEDYALTEIDIQTSPDLLRRYQNDIPVITTNGVVFRTTGCC